MPWLALALLLAADPGTQAVIPPGQDEAFAAMLGKGAQLPDGCTWAGALIDRSFVVSQYDCGGALVKLTLKHPSDANAGNAIAHTQRFVFFGELPTALREALVVRVRDAEHAITWDLQNVPMPGGAREPTPFPTTLALVLALSIITATLGSLTARWAVARWRVVERVPAAIRIAGCVAVSLAGAALMHVALRHAAELALGVKSRGAAYDSLALNLFFGVTLLGLASALLKRGLLAVCITVLIGFGAWWGQTLSAAPLTMFGAMSTTSPGAAVYPVNTRGFRGPEFELAKKPGVTRVALVGDSFVAGDGILQEDQTLAMHLQRELAKRDPNATWEVLNLGVGGNNLESHVSLASEALARLDLDVLVLCLTLNNDLSPVDGQVLRSAARRPSFFSFTRALIGESANDLVLRVTASGHEPTPQEVERFAAQSARLSELLRKFPSVKLVVFSFHRPDRELLARWEQPMLFPLSVNPGDFIAGDGHPTDHGAERFAQQLADALAPGTPP